MPKYHHVGTGPGNLNSRDYSTGGQLDIGETGPFLTRTYVGVYCSHPNLNQPYTQIAGSKHYHQRNNTGRDIVVGGCNYGSEAAAPDNWFGIFHLDDSSEFDWEDLSSQAGSHAMSGHHRLDSGGTGIFTGGGLGLDGVPGNWPSIAGIFHVEDDYPVVGQVDAFSGS